MAIEKRCTGWRRLGIVLALGAGLSACSSSGPGTTGTSSGSSATSAAGTSGGSGGDSATTGATATAGTASVTGGSGTSSAGSTGTTIGSTVGSTTTAGTGGDPFTLSSLGCPMAHCSQALSDSDALPPPAGPTVNERWHDNTVSGVNFGLGCSSNTQVAACTFGGGSGGSETNLVVFDVDGNHLWTAGALLDNHASASAPLVSESGEVIAADDLHLFRFAADGGVLWSAVNPGGVPISPNLVAGQVVLATNVSTSGDGGPVALVSAFDLTTGAPAGSPLFLDGGNGAFYATANTPSGFGNRFYVSTALETAAGTADPSAAAKLYAIEVDSAPDGGAVLNVVWSFDFRGPSGSSPLVIDSDAGVRIYFDGEGLAGATTDTPLFFGLQDDVDAPDLMWTYTLADKAEANAPADPRGGLWVFGAGDSDLYRLDADTGSVLQCIDVSQIVPGAGPSAALMMAGSAAQPVMITTAAKPAIGGLVTAKVVAIDLTATASCADANPCCTFADAGLWVYDLGIDSFAQFPLMTSDAGTVVIVPTSENGVLALEP